MTKGAILLMFSRMVLHGVLPGKLITWKALRALFAFLMLMPFSKRP